MAWLESFEPESGLRAQAEASVRSMGLGNAAKALETLLSNDDGVTTWEPLPLFADIARKAEEVQLHCAATMDSTAAATRLVPKDKQRAYALQQLQLQLQCGGVAAAALPPPEPGLAGTAPAGPARYRHGGSLPSAG